VTRFGQILVGLMAIFTMAASPINACACSHHETQAVESDAHENSCGHVATSDQHDQASENDGSGDHCKSSADCSCVRSTQKPTSNSETAKVKIHSAALLPSPEKIAVVALSHFSAPLASRISVQYRGYISHSHYTRGPPVS
jgi:hypothetical protein